MKEDKSILTQNQQFWILCVSDETLAKDEKL